MIYKVRPSDIYNSKEEVDQVLGSRYRIRDFRPPKSGELWIGLHKDTNKPHSFISEFYKGNTYEGGPRFIVERLDGNLLDSHWE